MAEQRDLEQDELELEQTSTEQPDSTTPAKPNRQSSNWHDDPEYRRQQSEAQKALAAAQKAAYEAQQYAAQMEAREHQRAMQTLEGEDRLAYQNHYLQQQMARLQKERDDMEFHVLRRRDLEEISRKTGVPVKVIEDAPSSYDAWNIAYEYKEAQAAKKSSTSQTRVVEEEPDDNVDLGSSRQPNNSKAKRIQDKYDAARKKYDIKGQMEAMAEADIEGVAIKEW